METGPAELIGGWVGFVDFVRWGQSYATNMHAKRISARGSHGPVDHFASVCLINDVIFEQWGHLNNYLSRLLERFK